jgi:hypothetical protein
MLHVRQHESHCGDILRTQSAGAPCCDGLPLGISASVREWTGRRTHRWSARTRRGAVDLSFSHALRIHRSEAHKRITGFRNSIGLLGLAAFELRGHFDRMSPNQSCQPASGVTLSCILTPLARRGCTPRSALRIPHWSRSPAWICCRQSQRFCRNTNAGKVDRARCNPHSEPRTARALRSRSSPLVAAVLQKYRRWTI